MKKITIALAVLLVGISVYSFITIFQLRGDIAVLTDKASTYQTAANLSQTEADENAKVALQNELAAQKVEVAKLSKELAQSNEKVTQQAKDQKELQALVCMAIPTADVCK